VLGKAVSKSASLMKDMDELTKQARKLQAEIALPCFMCTHDHSKYLAMEQYYYNKGRAIVYTSEENLMQVKSDLQQCQKQFEQERNKVRVAKTRLDRAKVLHEHLFISQEDVNAARSELERCKKDFQKAHSSLEEKEQEKRQAEIVLARLMHIASKQNAMDEYYYGKELKLNFGSDADLVTVKNSALQLCKEHVEQARTNVRTAEINLMDGSRKMLIAVGCGTIFGAVLGGTLGLMMARNYFMLPFAVYTGSAGAVLGKLSQEDYMDRLRSELGCCKNLYQKAQCSLKFEQKLDAKIDTETCTILKHHDCYYCNKEGQRLQNAAEVNQAMIAKKLALQQCQEQVERTTTDVTRAENKLRLMMFVHVGVGAAIGGIFGLIGGPFNAALMASKVATGTTVATVVTVAMSMKYLFDKSTLERCRMDYQRVQDSLKEIQHDIDTMQVGDKFTHLKCHKLVPVEWQYFYRHRPIVLKDVKLSKAEIEVKLNTRLRYYFSRFRNFF